MNIIMVMFRQFELDTINTVTVTVLKMILVNSPRVHPHESNVASSHYGGSL